MVQNLNCILSMKFKILIYIITCLLSTSVCTALTCVELVSASKSRSVKREYTAPSSHTENEALANQVIGAYRAKDFGPQSIWYKFTQNPQFKGPSVALNRNMTPIDLVAAAFKKENPQQPLDLTYLNYLIQLRSTYQPPSKAKSPTIFVTFESVGIRFLNRLSSERIGLVGFFEGEVDGRRMTKKEFVEHDIGHFHGLELKTGDFTETDFGRDTFTAKHFNNFQYDTISKSLSEHQRVLFDVGYYLYYHEGVGGNDFGYGVSLMGSRPTLQGLQKVYRGIGAFHFSISFDNGFRVRLKKSAYEDAKDMSGSVISRFRNPKDMRNLLPQEVLKAIAERPMDEDKIIGNFIGESFTVFLWYHYSVSRQLLGI